MSAHMPRDIDNHPIPLLRLRPGGAHRLAVGAVSGRIGPFGAGVQVISLYADGPVHLATGDGTVMADSDSHFLPAGQMLDLALGGPKVALHTHLAAVRAAGDCTLHISEKE